MIEQDTRSNREAVLIVGASRGLGRALVESYAAAGADVVGTVRDDSASLRDGMATSTRGRVEVEHVDIDHPEQIDALARRLDGRTFDLLFVVAGISLVPMEATGADVSTSDFQRMMTTNALGVMRAIERLQGLVAPRGTIAAMSSGQGSIAGNTDAGFEAYRATKAALNQLMKSYAVRHAADGRTLLLMAPGWVRTGLGGPHARLEIGDSIRSLVATVDAQRGIPGLQYLDRHGTPIPW